MTLPTEVLANLTAAERRQLINFNMGAAVQNLAFTVSNNTTPEMRAILEPIRASDGEGSTLREQSNPRWRRQPAPAVR